MFEILKAGNEAVRAEYLRFKDRTMYLMMALWLAASVLGLMGLDATKAMWHEADNPAESLGVMVLVMGSCCVMLFGWILITEVYSWKSYLDSAVRRNGLTLYADFQRILNRAGYHGSTEEAGELMAAFIKGDARRKLLGSLIKLEEDHLALTKWHEVTVIDHEDLVERFDTLLLEHVPKLMGVMAPAPTMSG